jgi:nitrile hydratase beta subunit
MDGIHDMGGRQGFGPIQYKPNAQVFHAEWERKANALYGLAVRLGIFNMDEYRHAIERMSPRHYMSASYYERTLTSLATLLVEKGVVTHEELEKLAHGRFPLSGPITPGRTNATIRQKFAPGDQVLVRQDFFGGHIRMPAYIRGKKGVVVRETPAYPFPDAHAHGLEAEDEPTYDVAFRTEDLWPNNSDKATVHVGVFQSYLLPV